MLIMNIYTLWGRKRFLLPVTYFLTNLVSSITSNGYKRHLSYEIEGLESDFV